ncbi:uncharacterized protein [Rutidosis leptorrhynchoides]|uniref:uncharacterized protein n=1 Tax=Rutidosis leptorrhynchoides TaxID=125765 RepID=UPI003A9A18F2
MGDSGGTSDNPISKLDFNDPLFLHPSDITSTPIITVKLLGTENFRVWKCAMTLALKTKNKFGFVDGSIKKNESNEVLIKQWERCNSVVLSWILGSISEELYLGQIFSTVASEIWLELKETYDRVDGAMVFNLHQKINSLTQNGSSLSEYYHTLNSLWKQFDAMVEIPDNSDELKSHHQMIKLMQFLMGLDDSYHSLRSNILTTEPLPSVKTAYSLISREESHRITSQNTSKKPHVSAFNSKMVTNQSNVSNTPIKGRGPNPNLKCSKCQKIGHTIDRCYEVVGYPPNYRGKMVNNKINHNYTPSWNNNNNNNNKNFASNSAAADTSSQGNMPFSEEQISVLMSLLNSRSSSNDPKANMAGIGSCYSCCSNFSKSNMTNLSSGFPKLSWIIDSGANQHYTTSEHGLKNVIDISDLNLAVEHPNESLAKILKIGDYSVSSDITFFDVLIGPDYLVNLMSVYKLAKDSKKFICFDEFNCYIQDLPHKGVMGKTLGTGSVHGGLYVFDNLSVLGNSANSTINTCFLTKHMWHNRLGHSAEPVMQVLKDTLGFGNDVFSPCDVCHKAKQTRDLFPLSDHISTEIGELIHLDVWGPYKVTTREGFRYFLTVVDDFSKSVWVFLLSNKSDTSENIINFVHMFKNQFNKSIKVFRSDNGTEFLNHTLSNFLKQNGIIHQTSCVYTPQQNGIEVINTDEGLNLSQRKYCLELINEFGLLAAKPVNTPIDANVSSYKGENEEIIKNMSVYQKLVGKLIYITVTRPDISYVVHVLSQFMHAPTVSHLKLAFRVLKYLKGCLGKGISINKGMKNFDITAFVDSDWGKNLLARKSITGFCFCLGDSLISWKSKRQPTVSRSSAEAEYRAMGAVTCELIWILKLLTELKLKNLIPMKMFCDNSPAIQIAANPVYHERTKHFDIDWHYVRDKVSSGVIKIEKINSNLNTADLFTKGLTSAQHNLFYL